MKNRFSLCFLLISLCSLLAVAPARGQESKADTAAIEKALRELDAKWSAAAAAKNVDEVVSYYAADAIVMPPNAPSATTKAAIRKEWEGVFTSPGAAISWKPTRVEVAQSGDLASTSGTYEFTMKDASGQPVNDTGKYLAVWKKQADGSWKSILDM